MKSIDAMFFLPTFAPVGDTRQKPEWFWLILNHLRIFYYYERKIDAHGAAGRGLCCTEQRVRTYNSQSVLLIRDYLN